MRRILIAALFCLPLVFTSPARSQVSAQINIGSPSVRPWPDGVWVPGYYVVQPEGRRVWRAGRWRHDNGHHYGWYKGKGKGKHGNGHGDGNDNGRGHGKEK